MTISKIENVPPFSVCFRAEFGSALNECDEARIFKFVSAATLELPWKNQKRIAFRNFQIRRDKDIFPVDARTECFNFFRSTSALRQADDNDRPQQVVQLDPHQLASPAPGHHPRRVPRVQDHVQAPRPRRGRLQGDLHTRPQCRGE